MAAPMIHILDSDQKVAQDVCELIGDKANSAITERGVFTVGLSGGSLAKVLCNGLPDVKTDWKKWRVFFCDERVVPFDNDDSTYKVYKEGLLNRVPDLTEHFFPIDPSLSVDAAAKDYIQKIRQVFPGNDIPRFDLLLLGMGPDGHTCSLFPEHPLLQVEDVIVAPISNSPKPPPERITLTMPVLNNARCAAFVSCGAGKAEMIKRILQDKEQDPLPAARVLPTNGEVHWFLDKPAASLLSKV